MIQNVKGILIDLDGVLYIGNKPIDGAIETISYLKKKNYPLRFLTNTTTLNKEDIYEKLIQMDFPISINEILNITEIAKNYLHTNSFVSCWFVVNNRILPDFQEIPQSTNDPQAIIIGDIGDAWDYSLMNNIFQHVQKGVKLIALHKGKCWMKKEGLVLDIGAFIAGIEYASSKQAIVLGKPSPDFYQVALQSLDLSAGETIMIGDDIINDIDGANQVGIRSILVQTGKYNKDHVQESKITPTITIPSISSLANIL